MGRYHTIFTLEEVAPFLHPESFRDKTDMFTVSVDETEKGQGDGALYCTRRQYSQEPVDPIKFDIEEAGSIDDLLNIISILNTSSHDELSITDDTTLRLDSLDSQYLRTGQYKISQRVSKEEHKGLLFLPYNGEYEKEGKSNPWRLDCYVEQEENNYERFGDVQVIGVHLSELRSFPSTLAYCSGYDDVSHMKKHLEIINGREIYPNTIITSYFLHDFQE